MLSTTIPQNTSHSIEEISYIFDTICKAAREETVSTLNILKNEFIRLHPNSIYSYFLFGQLNYLSVVVNGMTPIQFLAANGEENAVQFLLKQGARPAEAIRGFAMQGIKNDSLMEIQTSHDLYMTYIDSEDEKFISYLIGLAQGGWHEQVDKLLDELHDHSYTLYIDNKELHFVPINLFLLGYALNGNTEKVEELLAKGANAHFAFLGYSVMSDKINIKKLKKQLQESYFSPSQHLSFLILGHSVAGDFNEVNTLMQQCSSFFSRNSLATSAFLSSGFLHPLTYKVLLASVNPSLRLSITTMVDNHSHLYSSRYLKPEYAEILYNKIKKYHFTFKQAEASLTNNEIDHFTSEEILDYQNKIELFDEKNRITNELNTYAGTKLSWKYHKERASSLSQACQKAETSDELQSLIRYQLGLFDNTNTGKPDSKKPHKNPLTHKAEGEYKDILLRHVK